MNRDEVQGGSGESSQPVNLNDLQSYLVTFNKEIEPTEKTDPPTDTTAVSEDTDGDAMFSSVMETESQESVNDDSGEITNDSIAIDTLNPEHLGTQENSTDNVEENDRNQSAARIDDIDTDTALSDVHAQIAELAASGQVRTELTTAEQVQVQLAAGGHIQAQLLPVSVGQVTVEGLTGIVQDSNVVHVHESIDDDNSSHDPGKLVHVVSLESQELQLVDPTMGAFTQAGQLIHLAESSSAITDPTSTNQIATESGIIDGTDPVAVLASVAANTSNVSQIQSVQVSQAELNAAQLVAIQNSADSSQPQLVAVQTGEPGHETIQVIGSTESGQNSNPIILNGANSQYQTVTIMPSDVTNSGEMNYVLIVSQPDGEKEDDDSARQIALDMGMYEFAKDSEKEIVEEVIEEDGTTKRILRITPKKFLMGIPGSPNAEMMCNYCNYTSPKRYLLTRHMKSHSEDRPHKCNICERGFKTMASLQNHVNTHTGTRPHKCKQCEAAFTTSGELVRHMRYKHTFEKPHKCTECDYASVELSKLKRHMRSHTGERPYQCPHCPYASPDTYKLKRHLRIHTGEKPYECDVCHAKFTQSNSLKAHKLIHSGNKPVFQCELCPTTCGRKTDLKIHMQKLHTSEKPLICRKCNKTLPDRYTYKMHIKSHDGEKCFKCDHCDYAALSQRHLESHCLTHTGEKPFECDECEQTFRQKQLLKRHKNFYHTPDYSPPEPRDKMYDCTECDKSFAHKGNLLRHMQFHDPDNPVYKDIDDSPTRKRSFESMGTGVPLTAEQLLQGSILSEMKEGKLGNTPKVVIVHPDGRVEEVTSKLQSMVQEKSMEDMILAAVEESGNINTVQEQGTSQQQPSHGRSHTITTGPISAPTYVQTISTDGVIKHSNIILPMATDSGLAVSSAAVQQNTNTGDIASSVGTATTAQYAGNMVSVLQPTEGILIISDEMKDVETQAAIESGDEGNDESQHVYQIKESTENASQGNLHIDLGANNQQMGTQIDRKRKSSETETFVVSKIQCTENS